MNSTTEAITVPFYGAQLVLVEHNSQPYTLIKPLVEGMGISLQGQNDKFKANQVRWGIKKILIPSTGGKQKMVSLPLRKLLGWLMSINPNRIKDLVVKERIILYQNECDNVLWDYWTRGEAINQCIKNKNALPSGLTKEQQDTIKAMVLARADTLPLSKRTSATIKQWSAIKSKFGCSYKKIAPQHFTEVISLLARIDLEDKLLHEEQPAIPAQSTIPPEQIFVLPPKSQLIATNYNGKTVIQDITNSAVVPVSQVINLRRDFMSLQKLNSEMMTRLQVLIGEKSTSILEQPLDM
nr:phage antirepressor N-terminal domain-containing protein [Oceanisphaera pacifica]